MKNGAECLTSGWAILFSLVVIFLHLHKKLHVSKKKRIFAVSSHWMTDNGRVEIT